MRRAKEREMESQQCNGGDRALPMKFYNQVMSIPVVKFGVEHATGFYGRVKDFNTITHKSLQLAETVTGAVVGRVTPFAQRGICLAAQPLALHKIDDYAAHGLATLEDKVPVIKQEPQVIMSDMTGAVTHKLMETKDRVTKASEGVLISRPVQTYFDLLDFILGTASKTLDKVLPPGDDEADVRKGGAETEEKRAERGWNLLAKFFGLLGTAKNRVVGRVRSRLETTSSAADAVFKEAKRAVNHALPIATDKDGVNGGSSDSSNSAPTSTNKDGGGHHKGGNKNKNKGGNTANKDHVGDN